MTCDKYQDTLYEYIYDLLAPTARADVEAHIAGCDECQRALDAARAECGMLQHWSAPAAPEGLAARTIHAASALPNPVNPVKIIPIARGAWWPGGRRFWEIAALLVAVIAICVTSYSVRIANLTADPQQAAVYGLWRLAPGDATAWRVRVWDGNTRTAIPEATVRASLIDQSGDVIFTSIALPTDSLGFAVIESAVPDDLPEGEYTLRILARSDAGRSELTRTITVDRSFRVLVSTDKPLYQPGQTIHIRALSLATDDQRPAAGRDAVIEVLDAKANKVFKKVFSGKDATSDYGIVAADFVLADQVNEGSYTVRAIVGDTESERSVSVERYRLPKFKIDAKCDRPYYKPGEKLVCDISAQYTFGEPVTGAIVTVEAQEFITEFKTFAVADARTDKEGRARIELPIKRYFPGLPSKQNDAFVSLKITVRDTAGHELVKTQDVTVTKQPLRVEVFPESGTLVQGVENIVYILTAYADGRPARTKLVIGGNTQQVETSDAGIAKVRLTPQSAKMQLTISAEDAQGLRTEVKRVLRIDKTRETLLLRTGKAIYRTGETANLTVLSRARKARVFVDVVKGGRTVLMKAVDVESGRADIALDLPHDMFGTLQLHAWRIMPSGDIVADTRVVQVNRAGSLGIEATLDKNTYKPGETALLKFAVTNRDGSPAQAALSLSAVDEAVFALSEMRPGLERVYFALQADLLKPRFQLDVQARIAPTQIVAPAAEPAPELEEADVLLFSAAEGNVETGSGQTASFDQRQAQVAKRKRSYFAKLRGAAILAVIGAFVLASLVLIGKSVYKEQGAKGVVWTSAALIAAGMLCLGLLMPASSGLFSLSRARRATMEGVSDSLAPADGPISKRTADDDDDPYSPPVEEPGPIPIQSSGETAAPPRIRRYFPETLLWQPQLITDAQGRASLTLPLADSITSWRLSMSAVSAAGQLGSGTRGIRVFQDFFVDVDFPVALTQDDIVTVPVAVFNYLDTPQTVRIEVESADWFEISGETTQSMVIGPRQVAAVHFPLTAVKIGTHGLTVRAFGSKLNDAVERTVRVLPLGTPVVTTINGRLGENNLAHLVIPDDAVDGANDLLVKIYPGAFSQVVEGMGGIFRMPHGCFEQTSSTTYPNILVLDYMRRTKQIQPKLEMKALACVNAGYQRLLSFEVKGGGFDWYGTPPASTILTAYGLMQFQDMAKVFDVDPKIIDRTRRWLLGKQESNGSWQADRFGTVHMNNGPDATLRATAYVTWALEDAAPRNALDFIERESAGSKDAYTLALCVNALQTGGRTSAAGRAAKDLLALKKTDGKLVYWSSDAQGLTYSRGGTLTIEATALAAYGLLQLNHATTDAHKALEWLISKKDGRGTWHSTQSTVLAMRALLAGTDSAAKTDATSHVTITANGKIAKELTITPKTSEVYRLISLREFVKPGQNTVALESDTNSGLAWQVVGTHYKPWQRTAPQPVEPEIAIALRYDTTELSTSDVLKCHVAVTSQRAVSAEMLIVDLGVPPGFDVLPQSFDAMRASGTLDRYSITGRQVILYFRRIQPDTPITFTWSMKARFPVKVKTPSSSAYLYYEPEVRAESKPVQITVTQ